MKPKIFAALAGTLAVLCLSPLTAPPAAALSDAPYSKSVTVSNTNTTTTFGFPAGHVCLYNTGSNTAYFSWDAAATSTPGANVLILPAGNPPADYSFGRDAPSTVGLITASSTTTVLVYAFPSNGQAATCPVAPSTTFPASPTFSGTVTATTNIVDSALTASQLVATDGSKNLVSNGSITTNALAKSASSGATLAASALSDDGTKITATEPVVANASIQGNYTTKALTSGAAAAAVVVVAIPSGTTAGGKLEYCFEATDNTDYQARCGLVPFSAVNKAGTITCTLTATWSCADGTSGNLQLKATDTSSLTIGAGYDRVRYRVSGLAPSLLTVTAQ